MHWVGAGPVERKLHTFRVNTWPRAGIAPWVCFSYTQWKTNAAACSKPVSLSGHGGPTVCDQTARCYEYVVQFWCMYVLQVLSRVDAPTKEKVEEEILWILTTQTRAFSPVVAFIVLY